MKAAGKILFVVLSFAALFVLEYDYTSAHMGQDPFVPDTCPLCASFSATDYVDSYSGELLFLGFMVCTGIVATIAFMLPRYLGNPLIPGRSPPLA